MIDWLAVVAFPQSSVAVHVLVLIYEPPQVLVVASANVSVTELHASVAVGVLNIGEAGQLIVTLAPIPLITGPVIS